MFQHRNENNTPDNLRLDTTTGELFCYDRTDVNTYIKQCFDKAPQAILPVVILTREYFMELEKQALLHRGHSA